MKIIEVDESNITEAGYIHSESWKESHRSFCSAEFVEKHTPLAQADYLRREIAGGKQLYMLIDEYPVGIVSVHGDLIENLYVLPSEQRKGYGAQLLHFAVRRCVGIPSLWILNTNVTAFNLYFRTGFRVTGKRKDLKIGMYEMEMSMMENITIRKAIPGDEKILAYIQTESWKAAFANILSPEELEQSTNLERAEQMYHMILRRKDCNNAIEFVANQPHCIAAWGKNRYDLGTSVGELICIHSLQDNWAKGYLPLLELHYK